MSVRARLQLILLFVALVPLVVSATTALRVHRQAYDDKVSELHRMSASHGATRAEAFLLEAQRKLGALAGRTIRWRELSEEERNGAFWLVYQQFDDAIVVSLLDAKGQGVGRSFYQDASTRPEGRANHPPATRAILEAFGPKIPFAQAQKAPGVVLGEPFRVLGSAFLTLPMAVAVEGLDAESRWVVALGLSTKSLCAEIAASSTSEMQVLLVDPLGRQICPLDLDHPLEALEPALLALAQGQQPAFGPHTDRAGRELLVSGVALPSGWRVLALQPQQSALAASRKLLRQSLMWIGISLLIAVAAGLLLGRSISDPIVRLARGADALAKGDFQHRLRMVGNDEFSKLGEAFDRMSEQIASRDAEIRTWNKELQERVDVKTRELTEAHDQLLHSQKLAAVGSLGAGVAHEINNPLTGVLGICQLLMADARNDPARAKEARLLENVEREALRIKGIVKRMLSLSQGESGARDHAPVRSDGLLDATLRLLDKDLAASNISVVRDYEPDLPPLHGAFTQLQQALLQILQNAIGAMGPDGRIEIKTWLFERHAVRISITDHGKGIPPEILGRIFEPFFTTGAGRDSWSGEGLGLAIVHRVVENHHGTIKVDSTVGEGTTVTLTLPAATGGSPRV